MLEVFIDFICAALMVVAGFYIIKQITASSAKFITTKNILLFLLSSTIVTILYKINYSSVYTITIFALNILIYKAIFKNSTQDSTIATAILMLLLFVCEIIISSIYVSIFDISEIKASWILSLLTNISTMLLVIIITSILRNKLQVFYKSIISKSVVSDVIFFVLLIIGLSFLTYNVFSNKYSGMESLVNTTIMIVLIVLSFIFMKNRDNYTKLTYEYDSLFTYIQNFEEWIEKEQLNRHEYKNQLAVLRCLTKEKKVKDKIDEILEDNINLEGEVVHQLKSLPKGGIKGLMYYKSVVAQKNKINLTVTTSLETKSILNKLTEQEIRVLCKLIGIYFDNAIEAARETRKKDILIEIYEFSDRVNFVFSNSFKQHKNFKDRNKKGVSTKGEGRGDGLYFASKLISKNDWIEEKQEVIDRYYIQQLIIKRHKNTSSK